MTKESPLFAVFCGMTVLGCGHSSNDKLADASVHDASRADARTGTGPVDAGLTGSHDILTQRGDNSRSGVYPHETVLSQANVTSKTFGKLFTLPVDGLVYAQPLYVSSIDVQGKTRNVLIVATEHNSVYAFDADAQTVLWHVNLGPSIPNAAIPTDDILVEIGITSTPVIDRADGVLYVANKDYTSKVITHRLHALDLTTGQEKGGSPVAVAPVIAGTGDGTSTLTFDPRTQLQRPGLLFMGGIVYLGFASHSDETPYHGIILGYRYDASTGTLGQALAWSASQDGQRAGIWQGGQGLTVDNANNIYVMLANGSTTAPDGGTSFAEGFVKLSPSLTVEDWFIPSDFAALTATDSDVGSGGPILIPGTSLIAGAGKQGVLYVLDTNNMGHVVDGDTQIVQKFQITAAFYGSPLAWTGGGATRFYLWGPGDPVKQFVLSNGTFGTTPAVTSAPSVKNVDAAYEGSDPLGIIALSCNGDAASTAILWASKPTMNPNRTTVPGVLYAFDALTLTTLWDSSQVSRDTLGNYAKFVPPTVANGKVYMATHSGWISVYGLLSGG